MSALKNVWESTKKWTVSKFKPEEFQYQELPDLGVWADIIKSWGDDAYKIDSKAYKTMLKNDVVLQPLMEFSERMSGMQLTVVGSGNLRDELQKIVDAASGVGDALAWLCGAKVEGVRFLQHRAVFDEDTEYYIPDFRGCGARKWKAGGVIYWEGWRQDQLNPERSIGKVSELTGNADDPQIAKDQVGRWYDRTQWTVFRPGAGTNPEGDIDHVLQLFLLAESAQLLDKAMRIYADRYSLPRELIKEMLDSLRPDEMSTRLRSAADKAARSSGRRRSAMSQETAIELLEPKGATWEFLTQYREVLERRSIKLIWGNDLATTSTEGGDRGGKDIGDKQKFAQLAAYGNKICDALSNDWLPWLIKLNDGSSGKKLPRLKSNEPRPYLALRPAAEKQRLTVPELKQVADMKIPLNAVDVYATLGVDRPEGAPDVFDWKEVNPAPTGFQASPNGEGEQRPDRKQGDGGDVKPEDTKPQKNEDDLRNVPDE
jgi:hypothetical protein